MTRTSKSTLVLILTLAQLVVWSLLIVYQKRHLHDFPSVSRCMGFEIESDCNHYCGCQWCSFPESSVTMCLNSPSTSVCKNGQLSDVSSSCVAEISTSRDVYILVNFLRFSTLLTVFYILKN